MVTLLQIIQHAYPNARRGTDFSLTDDGSGPYIGFWNEATLGPKPTPSQLETKRAEAQAAYDAKTQQQATETTNAGTVETALNNALANNKTFIALASPSAAQNAAQIKALSRQVNGLIRLQLRRLDGTD